MPKLNKPGNKPKNQASLGKDPMAEIKKLVELAKEAAEHGTIDGKDARPTSKDEQELIKYLCEAMVARYESCPYDDHTKDKLATEFSIGALTVLTMLKLEVGGNVQQLHKLASVFGPIRVYSDMLDTASQSVTDSFKDYLRDNSRRIKDLTPVQFDK